LEFEGKMFDNVSGPRTLLDTAKKTAIFLIAAAMREKRRHQVFHPVIKPFDLVCRALFVLGYVETHDNELSPIAAPVIWTAKGTYL
jgi:hypothetical protein